MAGHLQAIKAKFAGQALKPLARLHGHGGLPVQVALLTEEALDRSR